jgi:hypothetical protein
VGATYGTAEAVPLNKTRQIRRFWLRQNDGARDDKAAPLSKTGLSTSDDQPATINQRRSTNNQQPATALLRGLEAADDGEDILAHGARLGDCVGD